MRSNHHTTDPRMQNLLEALSRVKSDTARAWLHRLLTHGETATNETKARTTLATPR